MSSIYRRCGCRDDDGKQYGNLPVKNPSEQQRARACPELLTNPKHGSFSWRLSRGFDPITGKRIIVNGGSFPSLKAAQTALNSARVKKDHGTLHKPTQETLATYAPKWLHRRRTTGKQPLAETTAFNYGRYIKQDIIPALIGKRKLTDLRRADVAAFVDGLHQAGRGPTTIARILATLQSILSGAVKDELMAVNVANGVDTPTVIRKPQQIWTPPQLAAFLEVAAEHRLGAFYESCLHTALRRGEVCGLRWADVDVNRAVATVRHNRVLEGGKVIETTPKTDSSLAEIELSSAALDALEAWRLHQDLERAEWGDTWKGEGHVFTYEDGRALDPSLTSKLFSKLAKKTRFNLAEAHRKELAAQGLGEAEIEKAMPAGDELLPPLTLHGLRHVAASYMWDSTGDLLAVSKALRHSSPAVTAAVYTHMKSGKQRALFDAIAGQLQTASVHTLHTQPSSGA